MDNILDSIMDQRLNEALRILQQEIERLKRNNQMLRDENSKLKDDAYKDNELKRLNGELVKMQRQLLEMNHHSGFEISEFEQDQIGEWQKKHEAEVHNCHTLNDRLRRSGAIGGVYTYEFIPTSIGTVGKIKCTCGTEFTFKDLV